MMNTFHLLMCIHICCRFVTKEKRKFPKLRQKRKDDKMHKKSYEN